MIPEGLIGALRAAGHVMLLTGAGISAESGLATFRAPLTGLWENFNPMDFATLHALNQTPRWCGAGMSGVECG